MTIQEQLEIVEANLNEYGQCNITLEEFIYLKQQIRTEFAHELKETFNNETPSNYASTQPFFTLENVRALVDMTLKEQNK